MRVAPGLKLHSGSAALPRRAANWRTVVASNQQENAMVLCPVALAVGCKGCPVFNVCPLKSVIGDYKPDEATAEKDKAGSDARKKK
jgi:hypothetical protein